MDLNHYLLLMKKKILWISRHPLWSGQRALLLSMHGKKCIIEEKNFRFENYQHFLDFLEQNNAEYFIYVVVSETWKEDAIEAGYSLGTIHKPVRGKDKNKKHLLFKVVFFGGLHVQEKRGKRVLNSKGFKRAQTKNNIHTKKSSR